MRNTIPKSPIVIVLCSLTVLSVVLALFIPMLVGNHAVSLEESVYRSQGDLNAQLTRRSQIVPDLVATVKRASDYEKSTQMDVISLRTVEDTNGSYPAGSAISVVAEAYPDLKANENYKSLMQELSITENLLFQYRSDYNNVAREYAVFTSQQPFVFVLSISGYEIKTFEYTTDLSNGQYHKPGDLFETNN